MLTDRQIDKIIDFIDDYTTDDISVSTYDDGMIEIEFSVTPRRLSSPYFKHCTMELYSIEDVKEELERLVYSYGVYEHCQDILKANEGKNIDIMQITSDLSEIQRNMFEIFENVDSLEKDLHNLDWEER